MTDHPITVERVRALAAIARNTARPPEIRLRAADDLLDMCDPAYVAALARPLVPEAQTIHDELTKKGP
ncbi:MULTISPECIES: hypothetical protein [Pseudomonas]|jgi:hypothetical protein|uniref:hypothetical protein n=1 Tax=Pseudomonas TaxID=286 RepID=UPI0018D9BBDF|nr:MULTISPECIES: hypothetical protein [Pseudomonas]MBH3373410.1 hypothetical protein [Pseudomonas juntendi]MBS6039460.1 hypothetical protein [Pseudomonas sp.]CAH0646785.1 hypothetical protein PSNVIR_01035 [Pseudomonas sp. Nvir]